MRSFLFHKIAIRLIYISVVLILLQIIYKIYLNLVQLDGYPFKVYVYAFGFTYLLYKLSVLLMNLKISERVYLTFITVLALFIRLKWILNVKTATFSDFGKFYNVAQHLFNDQPHIIYNDIYYYLYPYNIPYSVFLALIYRIFPSLFVLKLVNVLFSTGIVYFLYQLMIKITPKTKVARVVAFLAAIFPPFVIYTSVLTNQTISIFFIVWGLYLYFSNKNLIWVGIVLALANLFRPTAIIYLAALIFFMFYRQFDSNESVTLKLKTFLIDSFKLVGTFYLVIFLTGQIFVFSGISKTGLFHNPVPSYKFLVGINPKTKGGYSKSDNQLTKDLANFETKAKKLIEERSRDKRKLLHLFNLKITEFWAKKDAAIFWATHKLNNKIESLDYVNREIHYFYLALILFTIIYLFIKFKWIFNNASLLFIITFLGFWLIYIFIEIQTRYRYEIYPVFIVLAGLGMVALNNYLQKKST